MDFLEEETKIIEEIIVIRDRENKDLVHELGLLRKAIPPELVKNYENSHNFTKVPRVAKIYSADRYHSAIGKTLDMRV